MAKKRSGRGKRSTTEGEIENGDEELMESTLASEHSGKSVSNRIVICKNSGCRDVAQVKNYCRLHYLATWKKQKSKEASKEGEDLRTYLKQIKGRFPEEFFEKLKADVEEMIAEGTKESSDSEPRSAFEPVDGDEDMDTIIKGIRVEDY